MSLLVPNILVGAIVGTTVLGGAVRAIENKRIDHLNGFDFVEALEKINEEGGYLVENSPHRFAIVKTSPQENVRGWIDLAVESIGGKPAHRLTNSEIYNVAVDYLETHRENRDGNHEKLARLSHALREFSVYARDMHYYKQHGGLCSQILGLIPAAVSSCRLQGKMSALARRIENVIH